jgi:hypothetical protein
MRTSTSWPPFTSIAASSWRWAAKAGSTALTGAAWAIKSLAGALAVLAVLLLACWFSVRAEWEATTPLYSLAQMRTAIDGAIGALFLKLFLPVLVVVLIARLAAALATGPTRYHWVSSLALRATPRGFKRGDFTDVFGETCSIQESSVDSRLLWLGRDEGSHHFGECCSRMLLDRKTARQLLPLLERFVKQGDLGRDPNATPSAEEGSGGEGKGS